ncbi:hypothetical protein QMZ65_03265 [Pantoea sp. EABMAA-21]|uniref:hypothetical protein n=1 Tax=Pantoea sp. EABMAA-21 TaxID=3043302 RepID=UPI0024B589B0|nr:hypothetical protein [Pantoea sp. EABMAA-21]MDI9276225.1 hypothetical protein [Pantoea sp. EABMAA-21]
MKLSSTKLIWILSLSVLPAFYSYSFVIHDSKNNLDCEFSVNQYGFAQTEEAAPKGSGLCWRKKIVDEADRYVRENKLRHVQPKSNFDIAVDMASVCNLGVDGHATGDYYGAAKKYLDVISKYSGHSEAITKLRRAYDYGRLNAKTPRDCTNYVMGR